MSGQTPRYGWETGNTHIFLLALFVSLFMQIFVFPGFYWFSNIFPHHLCVPDDNASDDQSYGMCFRNHHGFNGNTSLYSWCGMAEQTKLDCRVSRLVNLHC